MTKTKKLVSILVSSLMITTGLSTGVFADVSTQSKSYQVGDTVRISGTTSYSDIIIKVLNEGNGSALFIDTPKVSNGQYTDMFTIGSNFVPGTYKLIVGVGENVETSEFIVSAPVIPPPSNTTPSSNTPPPQDTPQPSNTQPTTPATVDPVKGVVDNVPDNATSAQGEDALKQLGEKTLDPSQTQKGVQGVLDKVQNPDASILSAAADLINSSNAVKATGDTVSTKVLEDGIASLQNSSKYADELKTKIGEKAASEFKDELALKVVANDKGNTADLLLDAQTVKKLNGSGIGLQMVSSSLSALVPSDLIGTTITDGTKYIKFSSVVSGDKTSKTVFDKAKALDGALVPLGKVFNVELSAVDNKGKSTLITATSKPLILTLTLGSADLANVTDKRKVGAYYMKNVGTYEFKAGKLDGNSISFKTLHCSSYAVMAYNKSFDDVQKGLWSKDYIEVLAARHITSGVDKAGKLFAPKDNVTRGQFAAFLVRALGINTTDFKGEFKDVPESKWYAKEVEAAKSVGLIDGTGTGTFAPDENITREAMAKMILKAYEIASGTKTSEAAAKYSGKLTDIDKVSKWAVDYVKAAQSLGLINGTTDGSYKPSDKAQRQEVAKVIVTMLEKAGEI